MPFGRHTRLDSRRSSSYCSTATIVVFVALCLVGVWMMTSSTVVPVDVASSENKSEMKQEISETDSRPFEDSSGDVPDGAKKDDADVNSDSNTDTNTNTDTDTNTDTTTDESNSGSSQDQNVPEKVTENIPDPTRENPDKVNEDKKDETTDTSKTETYSDANGKLEGGDMMKEGGDKISESGYRNTANQENDQEKNTEKNSDEATNDEQEKNTEQNSEQTENNEQKENTEQNNGNVGDEKQRSDGDTLLDGKGQDQVEEKVEEHQDKETKENSDEKNVNDQGSNEVFPDGAQSDLLNETNTQNGAFSTQAAESKNEKQVQSSSSKGQIVEYRWKLCNVTAGADYIPCLDNEKAIKMLRSTKHYEHRERHCPEMAPTCLVPLPDGYKKRIDWPASRDKIWYHNVPHTQLAVVKGHQNWVKVSGEYLTFPGGGTQFKNGALHYIDNIQQALPDIEWGKRSRVVLDVGCGVASFGGYLFERDVLTMSFAPKDEHEAQVQFALERGIPAVSAVMGTKRLPFPGKVFDVIHCARCRVPWHIEGGMLLLELNRLLRPGGYFVWSATPVYEKLPEDVEIWNAMSTLLKSMCWDMVVKTKDTLNQVGLAVYRKPFDNSCYDKRKESNPPICPESDDPNAAWNIPLQACMHRLPEDPAARGSQWPEQWPLRLERTPYWLNSSQVGVYGKPAPKDFEVDYEHWKHVVSNSYLNGMGIDWSTVRNVMDMRSVYGGFAAALRDMKVWVMNVVSINSPDTLPIIYERGLFGMYHDWCESFSTYPRSYDLLHADHLFSQLKDRCKLLPVMTEVDRILRPEGKLIVRDSADIISEVESMAKSLNWEIRMTFSKENEGLLCVRKTMWRPKEVEESS